MKKIGIVLFCIALLPRLAMGQCSSDQEKPDWLDNSFVDKNNSYIETAVASGYTEDEARNKAINIIATRRDWGSGKPINIQVQNDNVVISGQDNLNIKARVIDEYREYCNGQYRVYLLVQTAKNPTYELERVYVTPNYDFSPRVFVPGMAQLYKGSKTKGVLFIAGEVALIGSIVAFEGLRASYESKINTTHNTEDRQTYINNTSNMQNLRNGFIAGAVALYVWNVIDGIAAKGKKHVVFANNNFSATPFAAPSFDGKLAGGVSLSFNF